jgi:hypothetical protein
MSHIFGVRFARLATLLSLAAAATLTLTAGAAARPVVPVVSIISATAAATGGASAVGRAAVSPLPTPSPEAGPIPWAMSTSTDPLPGRTGLLAVLAALAVAALVTGLCLTISRGPDETRRLRERRLSIAKAIQSMSRRVRVQPRRIVGLRR